MSFTELGSFPNSAKSPKRRRGHVSGRYCGRGMKGEKSRAGRKHVAIMEGGQMPLVRRLPKRGFSNRKFARKFEIVNLSVIEKKFAQGDSVNPETLKAKGIIKGKAPVKILAGGELSKSLTVAADAITAAAVEKIKKAMGTAQINKREKAEKIPSGDKEEQKAGAGK